VAERGLSWGLTGAVRIPERGCLMVKQPLSDGGSMLLPLWMDDGSGVEGLFKFLKFFAGQSGRAERFAETSAKRLSTYGAQESGIAEAFKQRILRIIRIWGYAMSLPFHRLESDYSG